VAALKVRLKRPPARGLHPLAGVGAQFNTNLFISSGPTAGRERVLTSGELEILQRTINRLRPGHSRIFIRRGLRADTARGISTPEFGALMNTIELAQRTGANVNLTWWGQGPYADSDKLRQLQWPNKSFRNWPDPSRKKWPKELTEPGGLTGPKVLMERFAGILEEVRRRHFDCVRFVTIQNEVNGSGTDIAKQKDPFLSMRLYELLHRHLDTALKARTDPLHPSRTLRSAFQVVAGDLVERGNSHQDAWLKYMHRNMELPREGFPSVLDAYSIHVYWEPGPGAKGFPRRLERRLTNLERTARTLGIKKPIYITEYGVRKLSAKPRPGKLEGVRIEQSPRAAFQHAWFNALAPQYGSAGLTKWVLYRTDKPAGFGMWGMIGAPSEQFSRSPVYRVTRLFNHVVPPGWNAAGLGRAAGVIASKFEAPNQRQEAVIVLNNSTQAREVRLEGLKPRQNYFRVGWNEDKHGGLGAVRRVRSGADGAAPVSVPPFGLVALSTRAPGL
jgi:hypothetical protein